MDAEQRCGACQHWDYDGPRAEFVTLVQVPYVPDEDEDAHDAREVAASEPYGRCTAAPGPQDDDEPSWPEVKVFVRDGSDYRAVMYTARDFGCVLFTPADEQTRRIERLSADAGTDPADLARALDPAGNPPPLAVIQDPDDPATRRADATSHTTP